MSAQSLPESKEKQYKTKEAKALADRIRQLNSTVKASMEKGEYEDNLSGKNEVYKWIAYFKVIATLDFDDQMDLTTDLIREFKARLALSDKYQFAAGWVDELMAATEKDGEPIIKTFSLFFSLLPDNAANAKGQSVHGYRMLMASPNSDGWLTHALHWIEQYNRTTTKEARAFLQKLMREKMVGVDKKLFAQGWADCFTAYPNSISDEACQFFMQCLPPDAQNKSGENIPQIILGRFDSERILPLLQIWCKSAVVLPKLDLESKETSKPLSAILNTKALKGNALDYLDILEGGVNKEPIRKLLRLYGAKPSRVLVSTAEEGTFRRSESTITHLVSPSLEELKQPFLDPNADNSAETNVLIPSGSFKDVSATMGTNPELAQAAAVIMQKSREEKEEPESSCCFGFWKRSVSTPKATHSGPTVDKPNIDDGEPGYVPVSRNHNSGSA